MYDTILVATDGSQQARAALEHALNLAESVDATVYVVTVVEASGSPMRFDASEVEALNDAADDLVEEIVQAYGSRDVEVDGTVRRGKPATAILEYADELDADLILVGQRGEDGITGAILGSTTDRLARLTDIPVTVVPDERDDADG